MYDYVLNAVKSFSNYGLVIFGSTFDPVFTKGFFSSKPNISIVGSSCFIDYSNTTDISDLAYIKKLFANVPIGTTFYISSANYFDEEKNIKNNLTGTFTSQLVLNNDKLIIGNIVSGLTADSTYSYFDKINFLSTPQYSTDYLGGATATNYILNTLTSNPAKSFVNSGIIGSCFGKEEYIEIKGSSANLGKFKINSPMRLKDNKEILYIDSQVINENLGTTYTNCIFYLRGNADPVILNRSRKDIGCYVVFDSGGNQISCFENQNRLQAFLRAQNEPFDYSSYWVPCLDCGSLTDNAINAASSDKSLMFDASAFVYIVQQPIGFLTSSNNYGFSYNYILYSNIAGNSSLQSVSEMTFDIDQGFKLDLSHPTLKNFDINLFLDENYSVPMTQSIYKIGSPGYDQASLIYQKTPTSSKVIYVSFVGPATIKLKITVT
jgi:hypothetical protein